MASRIRGFNNNSRDYALRKAQRFRELLQDRSSSQG